MQYFVPGKKRVRTIKPVFIFSLPRSGSTYLQRLVTGHSEIVTVAEPWLLLPLASFVDRGYVRTYSNYSTKDAATAISEFYNHLPAKASFLQEQISEFALKSYSEVAKNIGSPNVKYFLDKTPRYYLIIDFINELFPGCKKIFLTRSIDAVYASIMRTWYNGALRLNHHYIDLSLGPIRIYEAWKRYESESLHVRYEDLLLQPIDQLATVVSYLDLSSEYMDPSCSPGVDLAGTMGDPGRDFVRGVPNKNGLSRPDVTLDSIVKRAHFNHLIASFDDELLGFFGSDQQVPVVRRSSALKELNDLYGLLGSAIFRTFQVSMLVKNWTTTGPCSSHKMD
jgi:Sulfotransferase family